MVEGNVIFPLTKRYRQVYQLYHHAFPPEECLPFLPLFLNSWRQWGRFDALSVQGRFVGLSYLLRDDTYVFLLFLAIEQHEQGKGYGSQWLDILQLQAKGRTLLVAIEPLDHSVANADQRQKRLAFYRRQGYHQIPYTYVENGEQYQLLSNHETIDPCQVNAFLKKVFWPNVSAMIYKNP